MDEMNAPLPQLPRGKPGSSQPRRDLYTTVDSAFLVAGETTPSVDAAGADDDTVTFYADTSNMVAEAVREDGGGAQKAQDELVRVAAVTAAPKLPPRKADKKAGPGPYATVSRLFSVSSPDKKAPSARDTVFIDSGASSARDTVFIETGAEEGDGSGEADIEELEEEAGMEDRERSRQTSVDSIGGANDMDADVVGNDDDLELDWGTWEIDRACVDLKSICGSGEFGEVSTRTPTDDVIGFCE